MISDLIPVLFMGSGIGILSGFFAVGGGSILVPFLLLSYPQIPYEQVVQLSLLVNLINAAFNFLRLRKIGFEINKNDIKLLAIGTIIGSICGQFLSQYLSGKQLTQIFSWIILSTGIRNIYFTIRPLKNQDQKKHNFSANVLFFAAFIGGLLSSLTGLAGGIIFVPLFMILLKMDLSTMQIYNNTGMAFSCFWSLLFSLGTVQASSWPIHIPWWIFIASLLIPAQLTSKLSLQLSLKLQAKTKQALHGIFLIAMALRLIFR